MLFRSQKIKQYKSVCILIVCHFLTSQSWRDKWHVSWLNNFINRLSSETKPCPKSWPTLSIVWCRLYSCYLCVTFDYDSNAVLSYIVLTFMWFEILQLRWQIVRIAWKHQCIWRVSKQRQGMGQKSGRGRYKRMILSWLITRCQLYIWDNY